MLADSPDGSKLSVPVSSPEAPAASKPADEDQSDVLHLIRIAAVKLALRTVPDHLPAALMATLGVRVFDGSLDACFKIMKLYVHPDKHSNSSISGDAELAFKLIGPSMEACKHMARQLSSFRALPWRFPEEIELLRLVNLRKGIDVSLDFAAPPAPPAPKTAKAAPKAASKSRANAKPHHGSSLSAPDDYDIRIEYVNKAAILEFLSRTAARRIRHQEKGSMVQNLEVLLRRGQPVHGEKDVLSITVVSYMKKKFGLSTRRQTGIKVFGDNLPDDVAKAIQFEVDHGVPQGMIGKSVFHMGERLLRVVARAGLDVMDMDLGRCYTHLRYLHAPPEVRDKLDHMSQLLADPPALTAKLATLEGVLDNDMKGMITKASNMQRLPEVNNVVVRQWLEGFKSDNKVLIDAEILVHADLYAKVCETNPLHPSLTFMSCLDQSRESTVIQKIDSVTASNEYDGILHFFTVGDKADIIYKEAAALVEPLRLVIKPYPDPVTLARQKYPKLDWDHINIERPLDWLRNFRQCRLALARGVEAVRQLDTVFGDVVRGATQFHAHQPPGADKFELWDENTHRWQPNYDASCMCGWIRSELGELFGKLTVQSGEAVWLPPLPPLQQDAFVEKVSKCVVKYMTSDPDLPQLDGPSQMTGKLLFADGQLYNFDDQSSRIARPEDRLARYCPGPLPSWDVSGDVKRKVHTLTRKVKEFFMAGGTDLQPQQSEDLEEALAQGAEPPQQKELRKEIVALFEDLRKLKECPMLAGLWNLFEDRFSIWWVLL